LSEDELDLENDEELKEYNPGNSSLGEFSLRKSDRNRKSNKNSYLEKKPSWYEIRKVYYIHVFISSCSSPRLYLLLFY
jgi:hypothetical protein